MIFKTEQESFWAGEFGSEYIQRNQGAALLASNLNFFSKALNAAQPIRSCIEFGANIGMNLKALKLLHPVLDAHAIEINDDAVQDLTAIIPTENIYNHSILDFSPARSWDLAFTKGVLIHIDPQELPNVYDKLVTSSNRYILVAEYYNPSPISISYRGHENRLFKRDFAGEIMDRHPEWHLVDYGFTYHRAPSFPQDDITWFLMERSSDSLP